MEPLDVTPVPPRDADEFADLVGDGMPRVDEGPDYAAGGTVTSIGVVTGLGRLAAGLEAQATPDDEFLARLRGRLTGAIAATEADVSDLSSARVRAGRATETAAAARRRRWRPAVAVAGLAASVVTIGGVVAGSSHSLPGEPLYAIKRGTEALQVKAAGGSLRQGERHLQLAERRLREVKALAKDGGTALGPVTGGHPVAAGAGYAGDILDTLQAMDSETNDGKRLIVAAATANQNPRPLEDLRTWSEKQQQRITDILPGLPAAAQQRAQTSLRLTGDVKADATWRIAECKASCPSPSATLAPPLQANVVPPVPAPPAPATATRAPGNIKPDPASQPPMQGQSGTSGGSAGSGGSDGSGSSDNSVSPGGAGGAGGGSGRGTPSPEPTLSPEPSSPPPVPAPSQPVPTRPVPTSPVPTQPEPEPTQAEPTQAEPTQPEPTQPEPAQPVPTQAEPIQAEPTEAVPTHPDQPEPPGGPTDPATQDASAGSTVPTPDPTAGTAGATLQTPEDLGPGASDPSPPVEVSPTPQPI